MVDGGWPIGSLLVREYVARSPSVEGYLWLWPRQGIVVVPNE
jgi:hypothetical protein